MSGCFKSLFFKIGKAKAKGVTLVETVVVLILTSLIAVFSVYAYLIVKKQESILWENETYSTQLGLAVTKLSELSYNAKEVEWLYPKLRFQKHGLIGEVKFDLDSLCIFNEKGDLLIKVPLESYSIDTLDRGTEGLFAKGVQVKLSKLERPLVFEFLSGQDIAVNNTINWDR